MRHTGARIRHGQLYAVGGLRGRYLYVLAVAVFAGIVEQLAQGSHQIHVVGKYHHAIVELGHKAYLDAGEVLVGKVDGLAHHIVYGHLVVALQQALSLLFSID